MSPIIATPRPACLLSSHSTDGIGHQLHAKLSCVAAAAILREVHGVNAEYVRRTGLISAAASEVEVLLPEGVYV